MVTTAGFTLHTGYGIEVHRQLTFLQRLLISRYQCPYNLGNKSDSTDNNFQEVFENSRYHCLNKLWKWVSTDNNFQEVVTAGFSVSTSQREKDKVIHTKNLVVNLHEIILILYMLQFVTAYKQRFLFMTFYLSTINICITISLSQ